MIVLMDVEHYLQLAYTHLNDHTTYRKLTSDPTPDIVIQLTNYLDSLFRTGHIDHLTHQFLLPPPNTRTQRAYFLPKIHTVPLSMRPIVSCCSGVSTCFCFSRLLFSTLYETCSLPSSQFHFSH